MPSLRPFIDSQAPARLQYVRVKPVPAYRWASRAGRRTAGRGELAGQGPRGIALSGRIACLASAPLFKGVPAAALDELASNARESRLSAKHSLFREGEPAREASLLVAGRIKVTQVTSSGDVVIQRLVGPGEIVGDPIPGAGSLHSATPVALEPCDVLAWDARAFERLSERFPLLQRNALRIVAERVRDLEQRYCELATEKVASRLARTLLRLLGQLGRTRGGVVVIELSREELGQMIGATLFSVSRLLSQWEGQGVVSSARESIVVRDPAELVRLAEAAGDDGSPQGLSSPLTARR